MALAGEYCGEPWLSQLDLMLDLNVSEDRFASPQRSWDVIPFFHAVYHASAVSYGNYSSLVHPPYDDLWPPETAPPERLTLLDRKFSDQFYLEQARTFVWGQQPMIANFLESQLRERREELDFVARLARVRLRALKYLLHGTWLRPPPLDVPQREIDIARAGVYTRLSASKRRYPAALAGAWRAPDGDVGLALANVSDAKLSLRLPIDFRAYRLSNRCAVYRIDEAGRRPQQPFESHNPNLAVDLPPRSICVIELCGPETR
jgi:hypothetical protein